MNRALLMCTATVGTMLFPAAALAQQSGEPAATVTEKPGGRTTSYDAAYFAQFAPRSALDIVRRIPGFTLDLGNNDLRGFSGTAGNIVFDGQRPSSKSESLETLLARIPASRVSRVDVGPGDLYGAEYSGKAQVANLLLKKGGGMSGNASVSGTRLWDGSIIPNGSASVSLSRGPSTFTLSGDTSHFANTEVGFDDVTDALTGERLEYRKKKNRFHEYNPYVAGGWALEQGANRSLHVNARYSPSRFVLGQSNHVTPTVGDERDDQLHQKYKTGIFELSGDITRPLAGGGLKLVALANRRDRTTFDDYLVRNFGGTQVLGGYVQTSESKYGETLGKLSWSRPDVMGFSFETGAEVAYNKLDYALDLDRIELGGALTPIILPLDDATVSEIRGEFFVNAGRQLSKTVRVDGAINYELSKLKVRGDATADRSLKFLKPSLTVDWQPGSDWHLQLIGRRKVAQLDFYDFVSVAELSSDRISGGNANLVPQRTWEGRFVAEHPLLGEGKARFELGYDLVQQLQDRILIYDDKGKAFDSPGNLGTGKRMFATINLDAPLGKLWKGLRVAASGTLQRTRVKDPVSGQVRDWSNFYPEWQWDLDVRRDAGKFAYGVRVSDRAKFYFFRTDEIEANFNDGIFGSAFVEYRPTGSSTVTLDVENIFDTGGARNRLFFDPNRTNPIPDINEFRFRDSHTRVALTYKMSFGGSASK